MQEPIIRYYKYPDVWGSPIERCKVIVAGEVVSHVKTDNRQPGVFCLVPSRMLFDTPEKAKGWAEARLAQA